MVYCVSLGRQQAASQMKQNTRDGVTRYGETGSDVEVPELVTFTWMYLGSVRGTRVIR